MTTPDVSVVMSVYNAEQTLARTIESVLLQAGVSFEFIIVNDGSIDNSLSIIESYSKNDDRIKLINQENLGLTRALIKGCEQASGQYIARQDAGDISLFGRLKAQYEILKKHPTASLISAATRFETPNRELLYTSSQSSTELEQGLAATDIEALKGPSHHGSTMFPIEIYRVAGGYRKEFYVAQDLDLWTRIAELGDIIALKETYYCATVEKNSISSLRREQQRIATDYILRCCLARASNADEKDILNELSQESLDEIDIDCSTQQSDANYYYFVASNLLNREPSASLKYLKRAFRLTPFNWKIVFKLTYAYLALIKRHTKL